MDAASSMNDRPVVCVFCGASEGASPAHMAAARNLARALHENCLKLVYGGGTIGLMGEVARTLVSLSGPSSVHGIIPRALVTMEQHVGCTESSSKSAPFDENIYGRTTVVKDMHTRKQMMADEVIKGGRGGGFVALSGGYGTFEELMEVTTWNQLGIHHMPVVLYNIDGYWTALVEWVENAVANGFVSGGNKKIIVEATHADGVIRCLMHYRIAQGRFNLKWEEM